MRGDRNGGDFKKKGRGIPELAFWAKLWEIGAFIARTAEEKGRIRSVPWVPRAAGRDKAFCR